MTPQNILDASGITYEDWKDDCDGKIKMGDCVNLFRDFEANGYHEQNFTGWVENEGIFPVICVPELDTNIYFEQVKRGEFTISKHLPTEKEITEHKELSCGFY